jgi:hypothetical protein
MNNTARNSWFRVLKKNRIIFPSFLVGLVLLGCSWWLSYPLSLDSSTDLIFNHISPLYWIGLSMTVLSMFAIAITSKNNFLKWLVSIGLVLVFYSLFYFYYMLPGSDSNFFRGMTEYFINTRTLNTSVAYYFQWPSYFLLAYMVTYVSGIELSSFEFFFFTIIGFLMATAVYVYASKMNKDAGFLSVLVFIIATFGFLDFQSVPFSLAFSLLLLLFMLETHKKNIGITLTTIILLTSISFAHAFVGLFYIVYLFVRMMLNRSKQYGLLFFLSAGIYLMVQITQAGNWLNGIFISMSAVPSEYSGMVASTLPLASNPIDVVIQVFSRTVTVSIIVICLTGFIFLLFKRKLRVIDKAIFITGFAYAVFGIALSVLGSRAIPLAFIPISLGVSYFLKSKFRRYIISIFLILSVLAVSIPLHGSFSEYPIIFQTRQEYTCEQFMLERYTWDLPTTILSDGGPKFYLEYIAHERSQGSTFPQNEIVSREFRIDPRIEKYDCIIFNVGFEKAIQNFDFSLDRVQQVIVRDFNRVYDSGGTYIAVMQ